MLKRNTYSFNDTAVELDNRLTNIPLVPKDEMSEEEMARIEEEKRQREEKQRFNDAVDRRVNEIILTQTQAINSEAERILSDAREKAARLTDETRNAAKAALEKAVAEGEKLKEKAISDGFSRGFDEGKKDAEKKYQGHLEAIGQFLGEINSHKEAYYIENEKELKDTLYDMVEKIVLEKLDQDDEMIQRIISKAAKSFRNSDFVKISLIESNVTEQFRTDADFVKRIAANIPEIEIEYLPPEDNPNGSVILDNGSEIIDASVPTQLEFLKAVMDRTKASSDEQ